MFQRRFSVCCDVFQRKIGDVFQRGKPHEITGFCGKRADREESAQMLKDKDL